MEIKHQIEIWMSVAFLLYLFAFFVARRHWNIHVLTALFGFFADMYATYLMWLLLSGNGVVLIQFPLTLKVHIALSVLAILAFFFQAALGLKALSEIQLVRSRYRILHIKSAKCMFLPIWIVAYLSGFALAFL